MILVSESDTQPQHLLTGVSTAAAQQGAGEGEPCLSARFCSSGLQCSVKKSSPGVWAVWATLDNPAWLPLSLMSETCISLKYVSAVIGKTITQPLPVRFLSFLFQETSTDPQITSHWHFKGKRSIKAFGMSVIVWIVSTASSISSWIPVHQAMKYSSIIPKCLSWIPYNTAPPESWKTVSAAQFNGLILMKDIRYAFLLKLDL